MKLVTHVKKLHRRVAQIELNCASYCGRTYLQNWNRWRPASGGGSWCRCFFRLGCVVWFVVLGGSCCWVFCDVVTRITWIWKNLRTKGLKKIYVQRVWYDWLDSPFFFFRNHLYIRRMWYKYQTTKRWHLYLMVSRVNLLKWLRKKRDMITLQQCNVTEQYFFKL